MGTNFYWKMGTIIPETVTLPTGEVIEAPGFDDMDPRIHIGKRSAAGNYCYDCDVTLCPGGKEMIHRGSGRPWPKTCPKCGKTADVGTLERGPAAVELGFAKPEADRPHGVTGASSFSWAQDPAVVRRICEQRMDEVLIVDEYGRDSTGAAFLRMLRANCPVEFTDSIGQQFS